MIIFQKPKRHEYQRIVNLVNKADSIYFDIYSKQMAEEMNISSETVEGLIDGENRKEYICIYKNNNLVGFASFRVKNIQTLWLSEFYIDVEYQKSGFGTLLLNEIEKIAKSKNVLVVVLETDKNALWSVNFYKKNKYIILDKVALKKFPFDLVLEKDPVEGRYMFGKII